MDAPPLVSYVLVNWRTERFLAEALASIRAQTVEHAEIVLVDNASPDFDPALIAPFQPIKLISSAVNLGFAGGNNAGIAASSGEYIVLLNCDARLDPGFTARALEVFAADPVIGTVVPKLLRADGSGRLESTGHLLYTDRTAAHRGHNEADQGQYDRGGYVFGGTAAAIVYRRAMLDAVAEHVGGAPQYLDASFFAYFEDVDLDWRAQLAGWRAYYEPKCVAWHHSHGSGGRSRWLIRLRAEKNRYLMLLKNDTLGGQLRALGPLLRYEAYHLVRWLLTPALWPAPLLLLLHAPGAIRRRLAARRQRQPSEVTRLMVPRGQVPPPKAEPPGAVPSAAAHISVVVLTYNGLEMTRRCLRTLLAQTEPGLEIIVVDNASSTDEAAELAAEFPTVRTLRLPRNLGFAGGVNWGVSLAQGAYIALVNNDALLRPDCLAQLRAELERSGAAAVSGRLVNVETPELAQALVDSADPLADPRLAESWQRSELNHGLSLYGFVVDDLYGREPACFYPSGGLCLLRRSALEPLLPELLPQLYFAYHEDVWLGFALRSAGYACVKAPQAVAAHVEASTARTLGRGRLRFLQERNRLLNLLGYYPAGVLWKLAPMLLVQINAMALRLLFRDPRALAGAWCAWVWLLCCPLAIGQHRRRSRADRRVPDAQWLAELSGTMRGRGGMLNRLTLSWTRLTGVPHREAD